MGDGVKRVYPSEVEPISKMGKKLVAAQNLVTGHVLTADDIAIKSPGDGIPPYEIDNVIGKTLKQPLVEDEEILFEKLA
jgi:N-acetylneuraminate synthase/sialic acid synthase